MEVGSAVLAFLSCRPAGCVCYRPRKDHVYLSRLAVLPPHRRLGLGSRLLAHVEERARALGLPRVRLGVRNSLERQRAWYERLGYRFLEDGFHEGISEPTFAFLEKDLDRPA